MHPGRHQLMAHILDKENTAGFLATVSAWNSHCCCENLGLEPTDGR